MKRVGRVFVLAVVAVVLGGPEAARGGPIPSFRGLGDLPGGLHYSQPFAVSGDGTTVVGSGATATNTLGFRWTEEDGLVPLTPGPSGRLVGVAFGVNYDGSVIVGLMEAPANEVHPIGEAFRWTGETGAVGLGDFPGGDFSSFAQGVSGDGSVVAGWGTPGTNAPFRWTESSGLVPMAIFPNGGGRAYGISADGSTIVGGTLTDAGQEAALWNTDGVAIILGDLPRGPVNATANAASADGSVVVGMSLAANNRREAFRWTAETGMVGLGDVGLGLLDSEALAVSADGGVVVGGGFGEGAFIWTEPGGMIALQDLLTEKYGLGTELEGWTLLTATGISADATVIVGYGLPPRAGINDREAWMAVIPEPGSMIHLVFGSMTFVFAASVRRFIRR